MTPSKASFSPSRPSLRFSQNSSTAPARCVTCSSSPRCSFSSSSVRPSSAASVVAHKRPTADRSKSGGGVGARRRDVFCRAAAPACPVDVLGLSVSVGDVSPSLRAWLRDRPSRSMDGRTSFFCLEAGRISSRSTGTPNETRKSRRMRDLTQFWGCRGGGATSCDHNESDRSVLKIAAESGIGSTGCRELRS